MRLPALRRLAYFCVPFFVLLATAFSVSAQTYTFGQGIIPAGQLPSSVATADLNGDSKLDLVVTNLQTSTVSVFMGKPDGTYAPSTDYPTGPQPIAIVLGDFNGDGFIDIAVADEGCIQYGQISSFECGGGGISVLLGNGDGTFQPHQDFPSGAVPLSIQAADLNGDGKLDLIVGSNPALSSSGKSINSVSISLGNGDGTFQNHVDYVPPAGATESFINAWVVVADFNGDGKPDVATGYVLPQLNNGTFPSYVAVFLGNGDGTLQPPTSFALQDQLPMPIATSPDGSAVAGDFNQDGKQDLAVATNSGVEIFLGNGDGTFIFKGAGGPGSGELVAIDLNQDGKLDLVSANPSGVSTTLGNGDGTFQITTFSNMSTAIATSAFAVGDFNGDGRLDILATVINTQYLLAFPPAQESQIPAGSLVIFLGQGGNVFGGTVLSTTAGAANSIPASLTAADLNGDGKLDLAFVNTGAPGSSVDNTVSILLGKGDGTFQTQQTFATGIFPVDVAVADFNADGKLDLAVANQICALTATTCGAGSVSVLLGNGDGTFAPHQDFAAGVTPTGLTVANFSGKPGVAVPNFGLGQGTTISVLTGKGDGTLNTHVDYTTPGPPTAITSGDFNNDGKFDVVVSSLRNSSPMAPVNSTPNVSTFLGNGDGTFQQPLSQVVGSGVFGPGYQLAPTDFNGDGNLDVVDGHVDNAAFGLLYGKGDGTFTDIGGIGTGLPQFATTGLFALGDFNADGNVDVALVDSTSSVVIFQGNGQGAFQPAQQLLAPTAFDLSHRIAVAGDFNGDGGLDLAVVTPSSSTAGGTVTVYLNDAFKSVFPTSLSFGSVGITTESTAQIVNIHNPSSATFHISNISISGPFGESNNCGASLAPGSTCTVNVHFSPTAVGTASGALTLTDSTHASPQAIPLTGSGVSGPFLQLSPTHAYLGSANVGSTNGPQTVTLSNTGNSSLTITNIVISGANAGDFAQSNSCGSGLAVSTSCNVSVSFTAKGGGTRTATLAITDNAPGSPHTVNLTGTGSTAQGTLALSPTSLTFATQSVGTASAAQTVTLTNGGSAAVPISQISATGDFKETNTCGTSLAASASCQISVTFAPTAGGSRSGILTVAAANSPTVALSGTGADFDLAAGTSGTGSSVTVSAGATATYSVSLTGGAGFSGTVALACSGAPTNSTCSVSPSSVTLAGVTPVLTTVTVPTFAPTAMLLPAADKHENTSPRIPLVPVSLLLAALLAAGALLAVPSPRGRRLAYATSIVTLLMFAGVALNGCGGGSRAGGGPVTPPATVAGTYTIIVTATAGSGASAVSHNINLTLTVQ
jgi:FG-GAP-like repeat/Abnormal spindle-like microcephaly-assoc'd, ASPM-SPD-2-Hydin